MKIRYSGIGPAILGLTLVLLASCGAGVSSEPATAATIEYFEGIVTIDGRPAAVGSEVRDGAVIVTAENSMIELSFGDYRILRAGENSRLILDSRTREMKLDSGALTVAQARARRFGKNRSWQLRTPTTVAAVRGTFYFSKVESPDVTYFCLCNGKIHLEDPEGETFLDLEAAHHNAVEFVRNDSGVFYRTSVMKHHDDSDVESLADKVHVPIDWDVISE